MKRLKAMEWRVTFSGSWASTSFFSRRSKKGLSTLCKRRMIRMVSSSLRSTCEAAKKQEWDSYINIQKKLIELIEDHVCLRWEFEEDTVTSSGHVLHCSVFYCPEFASNLWWPAHPNLFRFVRRKFKVGLYLSHVDIRYQSDIRKKKILDNVGLYLKSQIQMW